MVSFAAEDMERDHGTDTAVFGVLLSTRACQDAKGQLLIMGRHTGVKYRSQQQNAALIGKVITNWKSHHKRFKHEKKEKNQVEKT